MDEWDLAVARKLRNQVHSWEAAGHQVQLHFLTDAFETLPSEQKASLAKMAFNGVGIHLHKKLPNLEPLAINIAAETATGNVAWASDNSLLLAPNHEWDLAASGARIVRALTADYRQIRY